MPPALDWYGIDLYPNGGSVDDLIQVHQYVTRSPFYSLLFIFLIYLFFSFFLLPSLIPPLKVLSVSPPAFIPVHCSRSASLLYYWKPNSFLWLPQLYCWYSFFLILPLPLLSPLSFSAPLLPSHLCEFSYAANGT